MALDFDAADVESGTLSSDWNLSGGSTVQVCSVWLKADSLTNTASPFSNFVFTLTDSAANDGWGFVFNNQGGSNDALIFTFGGNTGEFATGISTGAWFHALCIYDQANTTVQCYIDNVSKFSDTNYTETSTETSVILHLGENAGNDNRHWDGQFADLAFFTAVPSAGQRAALAKGFSPWLVMPGSEILDVWNFRGGRMISDKGVSLSTITGTTSKAAHPPLYYPAPIHLNGIASAGGGGPTANYLVSKLGLLNVGI